MRLRKSKHRGACNATIMVHDTCLSKYVDFIFQFIALGDKKKKRMSRVCVTWFYCSSCWILLFMGNLLCCVRTDGII
jgi:hypothetical protein